ncbi:MAG: hypothetical protein IPN69_09920 [Acidobacteria bacterium]|nr:hypothetical protein [Acidobacteriota bacterium]MBK8811033.1 hypothetical protein [Acidobacteriota bacterium]
MRKKPILTYLALIFISALSVFAQDGEQTRSITSDDFNQQRPAAKKAAPRKRVEYKLTKRAAAVRRKSSAVRNPRKTVGNSVFADIGVTVWKLRPRIRTDAGFTLPVQIGARVEQWSAERVGADSQFRKGDRVRLAIEPSSVGYLYVVDSEILSDGTFGDPYLIFPAGTEPNRVSPGMLVDIPDQKDELPYFNINPQAANYRGELLTVIVSPEPITFRTDNKGRITSIDELSELEFDAEVSIFSRTDDTDKLYTKAEADSSCGAKSRMLIREKASVQKPCGETSRQLTRDEPSPQTIYRVKTTTGRPAVAFVRLDVGN